jgi:hypothetical protein
VSGQLHGPVALPQGKVAPRYPLDMRLGGTQSRPGRCGEKKNFLLMPGIERSPLSLVRTTEKLLEGKSSGSGLEYRD